ncbi:uncharacterized protein METZ01_LOCUS496258, partial [marine metagenome]
VSWRKLFFNGNNFSVKRIQKNEVMEEKNILT